MASDPHHVRWSHHIHRSLLKLCAMRKYTEDGGIIQLHGCVPFYIWHLTWAFIILPSWEETWEKRRKKVTPVQYQRWVLSVVNSFGGWSKTTLNYWMMVEEYPTLKEEVLAFRFPAMKSALCLTNYWYRWSTALCALAIACRPSVSKTKTRVSTFSMMILL